MRLYAPLTPQSECGGLLNMEMTITTYQLSLQTIGKGDIQQHLTSLNTTYILVSDTLVTQLGGTVALS